MFLVDIEGFPLGHEKATTNFMRRSWWGLTFRGYSERTFK